MNDPLPPGPASGTWAELDDLPALIRRYERWVAEAVARFLDDPRDIEEAVQDTFVQAWRHRHEFRSEAAVFTWLYRIAMNTALMRLRRRRPPAASLDRPAGTPGRRDAEPVDDPLDDHAERLQRVEAVRAALATLPELQRLIVVLRDVEGYSNAEVAAFLGLPVTTVKARLHRSRTALRRQLHP